MNRFTIHQRLLMGFGLLLLQLLLIAGMAVYSMGDTSRRLGTINEDIAPQVEAANKMAQSVGQALSAVGNIGIVTGPEDVDREYGLLKAAYKNYETNAGQLTAAAGSSGISPLLQQLDQNYKAASSYYRDVLSKIGPTGTAQDAAIVIRMEVRANQATWAKAQAQWQQDMRALQDNLAQLIETQQLAVRSQNQSGLVALAIAVVVAVLFGIGATWLITRSIRRPLQLALARSEHLAEGDLRVAIHSTAHDEIAQVLGSMESMRQRWRATVTDLRDASRNIHIASTEISSGNNDLASRTERMSAELHRAAHEIDELIATLREGMRTAQEARQEAAAAADVAARGAEVVSGVVRTMQDIEQSSKKIEAIISVIDGIAFQTNILALNAAVEAARAGEQGRGFAVVATEVRTLASRSAEAAKEIKHLIGSSVEKVDSGTALVQNAGQTMAELQRAVTNVSQLIQTVADNSIQQESRAGMVSEAVGDLDDVTQKNAALVEEVAATSESLQQQTQRLNGLVDFFKVEGGGSSPLALPLR